MQLGPIGSLDLTRHCPMSSTLGEAAFRLLTYLTWPGNETRRKQFMATMAATALDDMQRKQPADFGGRNFGAISAVEWDALRAQAMAMMAKRWFHPHGGYGAVAGAPGTEALNAEIGDAARSWQATGQLLWTMRSIADYHQEMRGGASVNKAVEVMEQLVEGDDAIRDRTRIMEAWAQYRSVAHLCAAFTEAAAIAVKLGGDVRKEIEDGGVFFSGLGRTLAVARNYQNFMTTYCPHGRRAPLVPIADVWEVPSAAKLKPMSASIDKLPPIGVRALTNYRAPKRFS